MMRHRTTTTISKPLLLSLVYSTLFIFLIGFACWDEPPLLTFSFAFTATTTITNNNLLFVKNQNKNNAITYCPAWLLSSLSLPLVSESSSRTSVCSQSGLLARTKDDGDNKQEDKEGKIVPDIQSLRDDIRKWSRVRSPHAPNEATHALREMFRHYNPNINLDKDEDEEGQHTNSCRHRETIDNIDCNQVINAWSKSRQQDAPKQVVAILKGMIAAYKINNNPCIRPDVVTYTAVINTYARRGDYDGCQKMFMMQLNDYKNEHNSPAKPNIRTFTTMIDACSKCDRDDKPEVAMKLLKTINNWYERGDLGEGPNIFTYSAVINCWSKSNRPEGPSRALEILETMIAKYKEEDGNSNIRPNTITYNTVMHAFAKQGDTDGIDNVFTMMKEDFYSGNGYSKPDMHTYTTIIDAWSKSNNPNAPMEAESLLMEMIDLFVKRNLAEGPDIITYSAVINCWSKSNRPEAASRALNILETMVTKCKEEGNKNIRPDTITYSSVMDAYAKQGDIDGANKVFTMMKEDYYTGNINSKPNVVTYTTLIDAWSKSNSPNAPKGAESLLMETIDLFSKGDLKEGPDTITYNAVINCWSKSNRPEGPSRALDILETMISKYKEDCDKSFRPNTITYSSVMDAYAKQGDIDGANKVFTMMKADFESGNINSKPNKFTYTILMEAWNNYSGNRNAPFDIEKVRELINNDNNGDNGLHVH